MIQSAQYKQPEPKAAKVIEKVTTKALAKAPKESEVSDPESSVEGADFENELKASMGEEVEVKEKPVKVSAEQAMVAPSTLIKLPESGPDAVSPKVFDPALTQGVDAIIQPSTTEVPVELTNEQILKLAQGQADPAITAEVEGEIAQAMLKTPQVQMGRAPAVEMTQAEMDPQLVNMEDFVAQKNLAAKKSMNNASAYGMPNKAAGKAGADTGLKATQTVNELGATESGTSGSSMNSQQFILNAQADLGANAKANVKTFNMSNIKSENADQIMTQITDYIVQAKAAKEPTVNMRVNHEELGMIDITVNKLGAGQDAIAINIATHSADGKNFFQANSKELLSHLTSSGLNVSDVKVETPSQTAKNEFDFGSQSGRGGAGQEKQFGSEQNQKRQDSERRQDLWNLFKDKEAA
ncbi:MAG: flagellar hook-length control protein FliK [Bdellovibrionales bacterium]|nr:flagellar hook-length control protein FliK [Bdellovibrionales bacterium]